MTRDTHQYIRSTNWYADTFELDKSAIDLDAQLDQWIIQLNSEEFKFDPLRIVPAPKSESWEFQKLSEGEFYFGEDKYFENESFNGINHRWVPKNEEDSKTLRPLAHVTIRDQCLLTALMMCLANKVECLQKDASTDWVEVHKQHMVNYGNRLFCQYKGDDTIFSWGNSTTYSKYFSDYQRFLARPIHFGREALQQKVKDEQVYEIHLDIEKFYDRIVRSVLIEKINELIDINEDVIVSRLLNSFMTWVWDESSPSIYNEVCAEEDSKIPQGVPQGLVAGGFLANIYLLDFDQCLSEKIGTMIDGVQLVDYCRYVDDMRLIIVVNRNSSVEIKSVVETLIEEELSELQLNLNQDKTSVELFRTKTSGISTKLKDIKSKVSGPLSINEVDEQLGHLEGLIGLADSLRNDGVEKDNNNPLATIESPGHDVREDTLLRFSANKIHALLKQKRSLVAQEVDEEGNIISGSWDYLQERMARKFIACWSKDPSLVLLLKKGLELFPDKKILSPILQQLDIVLKRNKPKQQRMAEYCLCEIFRHASTSIYVKDKFAFPAHARIDDFFDILRNLAVKLIENEQDGNVSVLEQARFFCLVLNDSPLDKDTKNSNFNIITKMIKGYRNIKSDMVVSDFVANSLLANQLANDKQSVVRSVSCLLEKAVKNIPGTKNNNLNMFGANEFCIKIAAESLEFFTDLVLYSRNNDSGWHKLFKSLIDKTGVDHLPIAGDLNRFKTPVSLLSVIKRPDNPFAHENASLALLNTILNDVEVGGLDEDASESSIGKILDIANCKVHCDYWNKLQSLEVKLVFKPAYVEEPIFPIPSWVTDQHRSLYQLGTFLRSCLLGEIDWSSSNLSLSNLSNYTGLKSSFMKRQLGMMHSPEAINGETAPMSDWLSCLLFHLLQWPGTSLHDGGYDWPTEWNVKTLGKLVSSRIEYQKTLFCKMSGIPAYVERVNLDWKKDKRELKVMMVQSLLPLKEDFTKYGLMLNAPKYRARHRRHIASVAELLLHKLYSHNSVDDENYKKANIDLIVWPELAVNNDDMDILKRLADKTGAMILTGLTFIELPGVKGPNNVAKWIIPKKQSSGRQFIVRLQGKHYMTEDEKRKVRPWRPYQLLIELIHPAYPKEEGFRITSSICYDATDIKISADLKDKSNAYLIPALNRDVSTFDSMVDAMYYHMYQHVVLVNSGEFGGSVAKAPYGKRYDKLITHVHGINQVSISTFEMNMFDFRNIGKSLRSGKELKTKPAG